MSNFLAVATVTCTLRQILQDPVGRDVPGATVTTLRPDNLGKVTQGKGVNLFLYQVTANGAWRNTDLPTRDAAGQVVQRPQIALDLNYLLTFYGEEGEFEPQRLLGSSMSVLHARPVLDRETIRACIRENPLLADSDLAEQFELVKLSPLPLNLEELSKMWSVFFQVPYHLSVAYHGTVVLIESALATKVVLPVRSRGVFGTTGQRPLIEKLLSRKNPTETPQENQPIHVGHQLVLAGKRLLIQGKEQRGDLTIVRFDDAVIPLETLAEFGEARITLPLTPTASLPESLLHVGKHCVQVAHEMDLETDQEPHRALDSNAVFFILRPEVVGQPQYSENPGVTVQVNPKLLKGTEVALLLNRLTDDAPPTFFTFTTVLPEDASAIKIPVRDVRSGEYFVRVRVNGFESPIMPDENGQLGPRVQITPGTQTPKMHSESIVLSSSGEGDIVNITGVVTVLDESNHPIEGVEVIAEWTQPNANRKPDKQSTNNNGRASLVLPGERGTYVFQVKDLRKSGYAFDKDRGELRDEITVMPRNLLHTNIDFDFAAAGNRFEVVGLVNVLDGNNQGVVGARVRATWTLPGGALDPQTINADGSGLARFTAHGGAGIYILTITEVTKSGFTLDRANSELTDRTEVSSAKPLRANRIEFDPEVERGGFVDILPRVLIQDETGANVTDKLVTVKMELLHIKDGTRTFETDEHTDNFGYATFAFANRKRGNYMLTVTEMSAPGFYFDRTNSKQLSTTRDIPERTLRCQIHFQGPQYDGDKVTVGADVVVRDDIGSLIPEALVKVEWIITANTEEKLQQQRETNEDSNARFTVEEGPRGTYKLTVLNISKDGYKFDPENSEISESRIYT